MYVSFIYFLYLVGMVQLTMYVFTCFYGETIVAPADVPLS